MSPTCLTRWSLRMMTRRPSAIQSTTVSLTSQKPHARTLDGSVLLQCETSVSQISRGDIALQKESKESLTRDTKGKQRMRVDRDGSVISVGESMSRRSRRNSTRSRSHPTHREFYSGERDLHFERRAQQAIHGVKIQFKENCSLLSRIWKEEIQNMHSLSHNVSLNLRDNNY